MKKQFNKKQISAAVVVATGESVAVLAAKHNYTRAAFYDAIRGRTKSRKIREIIAAVINIPISDIWPDMAVDK